MGQAERYEDMISAMKKVVNHTKNHRLLTVEERNLLSVAYKNVVGARRASWRILSSIEQKGSDGEADPDKQKTIKDYRSDVEKELSDISQDILEVLTVLSKAAAKEKGSSE